VGRKNLPAKDLHELVVWLKANPNKVSAAVVTIGIRFLAMNFQKETATKVTLVPYRGVAPAMQDLVAGQIDLLLDSPRTSLPLIRAGSIRPYVVTGDTRLAVAPDIPTFAEMGFPAQSYSEWIGLFAPRGTRRAISSAGLTRLLLAHSPIKRYERGSANPVQKFSRANDRPRKRSANL
jgi:tripartite-type tricarboxylate transporter receptor subunit TctC